MAITFSDAAKKSMEAKGLKEADVKQVVEGAGKDRIYDGKRFIAKKKIGDLTVYADYSENGDNVVVNSVYCHKLAIRDIVLAGEETSWKYCKNGKPVLKGHTDLEYMGAVRSGPSLVEPESGESWFEEYLANGALATAEALFQQKRA
ncbi:MAG: hypothetical protein PHX75_01065 [Candidatus Methanomethylophilaceae archaeon]|nr:hypothetical protein [Candidatus Methanomethylophilaceae archaeon]